MLLIGKNMSGHEIALPLLRGRWSGDTIARRRSRPPRRGLHEGRVARQCPRVRHRSSGPEGDPKIVKSLTTVLCQVPASYVDGHLPVHTPPRERQRKEQDTKMEPIRWLHLSDLHLRNGDTWALDRVLLAFWKSVAVSTEREWRPDFILFSGDIAYSGQTAEYDAARRVFGKLSDVTTVPRERIFCVPGNHDINRAINQMGFWGARLTLNTPAKVNELLGKSGEMELILMRQANYREFQKKQSGAQQRHETPERLGYVSRVNIRGIDIAIIGLDSSWLSGEKDDPANLLIGERQVASAIDSIKESDPRPNLIIAMAHHPLHMLRDFDRNCVQRHIEKNCEFFFCGHTHSPEHRRAGRDAEECINVCTGALYAGGFAKNSYLEVSADLANGTRTVQERNYDNKCDEFVQGENVIYNVKLDRPAQVTVGMLAKELVRFHPSLQHPHYLAALLLGEKSEVPVSEKDHVIFCPVHALCGIADRETERQTRSFLAFGNILSIFAGHWSLRTIIEKHGQRVSQYGDMLEKLSASPNDTKGRLAQLDKDAQSIARRTDVTEKPYSEQLIEELVETQDIRTLQMVLPRYCDAIDANLLIRCREVIETHGTTGSETWGTECVVTHEGHNSRPQKSEDRLTQIALHVQNSKFADAKTELLAFIEEFPGAYTGSVLELGKRIIEHVGDRDLRVKLSRLFKDKEER